MISLLPPTGLSDRVSVSRSGATTSPFVETTVIVASPMRSIFHHPLFACNPDARQSDSRLRAARYVTTTKHRCAGCQRHLRFRLPSLSSFVAVGVGVGVGIKRTVFIFLRPMFVHSREHRLRSPSPSVPRRSRASSLYPLLPQCARGANPSSRFNTRAHSTGGKRAAAAAAASSP